MSEFLYCLNTSTIRPVALLEKIRIAGQLGYQAIEPWNDELTAFEQQGGSLADVRRAVADAGLRVVSVIALHSWVTTEGEAYREALDECRRRMDQAAYLGSPIIVASPPREVVDLGRAASRFRELVRLGDAAGVLPVMEFLGFVEGIKDAASAWQVASGSGDPRAAIVADVFHMIRGGGSVDDLLQLRGDQVAHFHIDDVPASPPPLEQADADRVMPGDGTVDLERVIALLHQIGYRGAISLELFNPRLWAQDPTEVCRVGLERMRALVEA